MKSILIIFAFITMSWLTLAFAETAKPIDITVHRSPTCGCCEKWVEHLKQNNFNVKDVVTNDLQVVKDKHKIAAELSSCHTAIVGRYVVEGHVPAADIKKMLEKQPKIVGITVPGMPSGTPGMEMGGKKDAYQVYSFNNKDNPKVFSEYKAE